MRYVLNRERTIFGSESHRGRFAGASQLVTRSTRHSPKSYDEL